jgi:hypothetical protein
MKTIIWIIAAKSWKLYVYIFRSCFAGLVLDIVYVVVNGGVSYKERKNSILLLKCPGQQIFWRKPLTKDEFLDKATSFSSESMWQNMGLFIRLLHPRFEKMWQSCFEVEGIGISIEYKHMVSSSNPVSCTDVGGRHLLRLRVHEGCSYNGYKRKWNVRTKVLSACPCVNALLKVWRGHLCSRSCSDGRVSLSFFASCPVFSFLFLWSSLSLLVSCRVTTEFF